jgi:hypothetical protein
MAVTVLLVVVSVLTGIVGLVRGVRAEAITLCGVAAGVSLFGPHVHGEPVFSSLVRLFHLARNLTSGKGFAGGADQGALALSEGQLLFLSIVFFLGVVALSYLFGSHLGGPALTRSHRAIGLILGIVNGVWIVDTFVGNVVAYAATHTWEGLSSLVLPVFGKGDNGFLSSYGPTLLFAVIAGLTVFAVFGFRRSH